MTSTDTNLLNRIRSENLRKNTRKPLRMKAFPVVGAISARYGLGEEFIERFKARPAAPSGIGFIQGPFKRKRGLETLPFFLAGPDQYRLILRILEAAENNPYMPFACSPDELLISPTLFAMNPEIRRDLLQLHHFETLFLAEVARTRVASITKILKQLADQFAPGPSHAAESAAAPRDFSFANALRGQIRALNDYITFIENPAESEGDKWPER